MQEIPIEREEAYRLLPEVLDFTWESEQKLFTVDACDGSAYCRLVFSCKDVWFCWNSLPEDAWFQDWP